MVRRRKASVHYCLSQLGRALTSRRQNAINLLLCAFAIIRIMAFNIEVSILSGRPLRKKHDHACHKQSDGCPCPCLRSKCNVTPRPRKIAIGWKYSRLRRAGPFRRSCSLSQRISCPRRRVPLTHGNIFLVLGLGHKT